MVETRMSSRRPSRPIRIRPSWGRRRSAMFSSAMILMREVTAARRRLGGVSASNSTPSIRYRTRRASSNGSMWTSEAPALIAFSIRRFTSRTTGASNAMSRSEVRSSLAGLLAALVLAHGLDDLLDRGGARAEVALDRLEDRGLGRDGQTDVEPERAPELVHHGRVGGIGAGDHQGAAVDRQGAKAVLAHVLGGQPLEEGRARRELGPVDVADLEVAGQGLGDLVGTRQPEPDQGVGQALARRLAVGLGPSQLRLRQEASRREPSSEGRGVAGIHGVGRIRAGNSIRYRRGQGVGKECFP